MTPYEDDNDAIDAQLRRLFAADTAAQRVAPNLAARSRAMADERAARAAARRATFVNVLTAVLVALVCAGGYTLMGTSSESTSTSDGVFGSSWTLYELAAVVLLIVAAAALQVVFRPADDEPAWGVVG